MNFDENIEKIEKTVGYVFRDKSLLRQAFTRTSFCNENSARGCEYQSNEVLEFLGDSVLSCAIIGLLLEGYAKRYPYGIKTELNEGDFSNIKSSLSDKKNLSESMRALGLQKYLIMGEGDRKLGIENEPSVMEDLFESIIGAAYLDCDGSFKVITKIVSKMLDVSGYLNKKAPRQSAKNALQEWCANKAHRLPAPIYKTVAENGPDHKKSFERACFIGDKIYGTGTGKNQKIADSLAAEAALENLIREEEKRLNPKLDPKIVSERLKELAKKNKKPSPEFRDLGERDGKFFVECRFMGKSAVGNGVGKRDAKEAAAEAIFKLFAPAKPKSEAKKPAVKNAVKLEAKNTAKTAPTKRKFKKNTK